MRGSKPRVQRNLAALIKRPDRHAKWFAASVTLVEARTMRFTMHERGLIYNAAMRADRAVRPNPRFKPFAGFGFVGEYRV